jgi:preprotein translocase subunit YajC
MSEFVLFSFVLILLLAAYWSLVIFPRQRDFQKRQSLARSLAAGDEVITAGGIIGKVLDIRAEEGIAYVELAEGVVIRVITASLLEVFDPEELARNARMGLRRQQAQDANDPMLES